MARENSRQYIVDRERQKKKRWFNGLMVQKFKGEEMKFRLELDACDKIPIFYGLSYRTWNFMSQWLYVCFPIPFNLLIRWFRELWWFIKGLNQGKNSQEKHEFKERELVLLRKFKNKLEMKNFKLYAENFSLNTENERLTKIVNDLKNLMESEIKSFKELLKEKHVP